MITLEHVSWDDPRAVHLRDTMMTELAELYPDLGAPGGTGRLLAVGSDGVLATILASDASGPVGHAAIRRWGADLEVKRVFVQPSARRDGVAGRLMAEVEATAVRLGAPRLILHTGDRQPAALSLYRRLGYTPIPLYEPYATTMPHSFCFEKFVRT